MPREAPFTFQFPSPAEALGELLSHARPVEAESIPLAESPGRVLAQAITTDRPSPPADVSSMDGYAVRLADVTTNELPIAGEVRIGREPPSLPAGTCLRIVTGGAIPVGADAVIKREDVTEHPDRIQFPRALRLQSGQYIRRAGENLAAGALVVPPGTVITSPIAGALATFGVSSPAVHRRIELAVLTTGDELVEVHKHPTPFQLRDSNGPALRSLFQPLSFICLTHTHIPDDAPAMNATVARALATADAVILTGGVSMGHRDFVADALAANGIRTIFHGVPQRPGKPILGGIAPGGRPILALPGNPVSVMVTARRIALPAIRARAGITAACSVPSLVHLANPDTKAIDLWWHRPVRLIGAGGAELLDARSSGDIPGAAATDGFVEIPPHNSGPGPWPFYAWQG
ncbi:MAG TPA: molybdopterin molybdotransferase MoeA [Phycisphaerales bacterium]|nr:molybdopterin molybdotransferase MoeA [Phycisphaerales bacterium]